LKACLLLCACLGADPVYDADPDHPWNRLYEVFYTHRFGDGTVYSRDWALEPPWITWSRFHNEEEFFHDVVARLEAFQQLPADRVEGQSPLRRALFLRDLWVVFDRQSAESLTKEDVPRARQHELSARLAKAMRRLELSEIEARQLPDTIKLTADRGLFPPDFDAQHPELGFLPENLCEENGPWVVFAPSPKSLNLNRSATLGVGASRHLEFAAYRSLFTLHLRVQNDRQAAVELLNSAPDALSKPPVPAGAVMALLRRTMLPATNGKPVETSLVESLQIIVTDPKDDKRYKFVLDRAGLIAGKAGLRRAMRNDPIDEFSFGGGSFRSHSLTWRPNHDSDGEPLLETVQPFELRERRHDSPLLDFQCNHCHPRTTNRLFASNFSLYFGPAISTTSAEQAAAVLRIKEQTLLWKRYQELRRQ
jgi:hypothetical protein